MLEIANKAIGPRVGERERIAPEVPLEGNDGEGSHTRPDHTQGRFPACETRVEKAEAGYHEQHHGRGHNDVGLISRLEPLIQILRGYSDCQSRCSRVSQHRKSRNAMKPSWHARDTCLSRAEFINTHLNHHPYLGWCH